MNRKQTPTFEAIAHNGGQILMIQPPSAVGFIADSLRFGGLETRDIFVAGDIWVSGSLEDVQKSLGSAAIMTGFHEIPQKPVEASL